MEVILYVHMYEKLYVHMSEEVTVVRVNVISLHQKEEHTLDL